MVLYLRRMYRGRYPVAPPRRDGEPWGAVLCRKQVCSGLTTRLPSPRMPRGTQRASDFMMTVPRVPRDVSVHLFRRTPEGLRFLMMRRIRSRGGFWQGITGAPLPHERDDEAAIREVQEETGFDVTRELIRLGVEYEYAITPAVGRSRGYHPETRAIHVASFAAEITRDLDPILDPNEHDEFVWCSYEQAHALLDWPTERHALEGRGRALRMIASVLGDST